MKLKRTCGKKEGKSGPKYCKQKDTKRTRGTAEQVEAFISSPSLTGTRVDRTQNFQHCGPSSSSFVAD